MPTVTLNPNIVSLLAILGRRSDFDAGQDDLVSDILRFVGNGIDANTVRDNQAQYIEAARKLSDGQSITDQEALLKGAQRAFSNLNPQEFVVTCNGRSLAFNTARFIEFFHWIHVGFGQINELVNEPDLLIYPNHERFGPLLRTSVHNPPDNADSILREPGFMQAVFKAFGDLERASDMVELGGLIVNLENELDVNKIDWACKQITSELDKQPEAKPEAGEPACGIVGRFKEKLSSIVHNIGPERAMAFGHQVAENIQEIVTNSGGTPTTIAAERFRNLVKDFNLDSTISFRERSLIKHLYFLLGGDPECNFENSILRDDRLAITNKCHSLNEACGSGISALVMCIDYKTKLNALNNKLGAETDTKKQAAIVKAFIEGDEIPANLKSYEPVTNLLAKLTEIANGTAKSTADAKPADSIGDPPKATNDAKAKTGDTKAKLKEQILTCLSDILHEDPPLPHGARAKLSQIIDATDFTKVQPQYGLAALLAGLEKRKTPIEKSDYLGTYTGYWKGCGALANEAHNTLDELHVKMFNLEDISVEGLSQLGKMFADSTAMSDFNSLIFDLGLNAAKKLVSREDVLAVSERLNRATTWQEAKSIINDFCTEHLGEEFTQLDPVKKHFVMHMLYSQAVGSTKILEVLADQLKPKAEAEQAKAKATDSQASQEGKKAGSWWSNIPIIGFIGSLIASGIGLIWAFKAENKKPPIILTIIGAIGAVITGLINWVFNKGGKEDSQADNQNNQPKTQTARREETAAPEVA